MVQGTDNVKSTGLKPNKGKADPQPDPRTGRIIRAALNVHHILSAYFQELTY